MAKSRRPLHRVEFDDLTEGDRISIETEKGSVTTGIFDSIKKFNRIYYVALFTERCEKKISEPLLIRTSRIKQIQCGTRARS